MAPSRAMISAVARPMPLAKGVMTATLSVNRMAPPFRLCYCQRILSRRDEHGRTANATRDSSASRRRAGDAGEDPRCRDARRASRLRRWLGQRTHHRAARALSAVAVILRPGAEPDLG